MHDWQFIFMHFAIYAFIIQMILIAGVFIISKLFPVYETDRKFLEGIYKKQ